MLTHDTYFFQYSSINVLNGGNRQIINLCCGRTTGHETTYSGALNYTGGWFSRPTGGTTTTHGATRATGVRRSAWQNRRRNATNGRRSKSKTRGRPRATDLATGTTGAGHGRTRNGNHAIGNKGATYRDFTTAGSRRPRTRGTYGTTSTTRSRTGWNI